jgi:myo-inositol-1-phosphate synthase
MHIGPSDFVPWLQDRKWAYIRMEGTSFGDQPLNVELKLEVHDSPNSAGVVIDALRCAKLGLDRGESGTLAGPSAYFMKSPPDQYRDDVARQMVEDFIAASPARVSRPAAVVKRARKKGATAQK